MAKRFLCSPGPTHRLQFGSASLDLLSETLISLNHRNKDELDHLEPCSGNFKHTALIECIFQMTQELRLDPLVGYCAIEILERFMVKHLKDTFTANTPCAAVPGPPSTCQDLVFEKLKVKFTLTVFSCVQIASKLWLHTDIVDNNQAVQFLHSMGHTVSKKALMESELQILKGLDFKLDVPNPLTYVEILLEVLGHNEPSTPMEQLYGLCGHVLRFVSLQRTAIYESLLKVTTQCCSPSPEQRENFLTVTEDCMLLGVGVITVAAVIWNSNQWEQVVEDLSLITGISQRSIWDFSQVTLEQLTKTSSPVLSP
ncbi:cyclin N-terminal domain-containing protein 1 [Gadus macrocephalus]|uniref:cyclin N-terminal domain-containing protein 1 n=1 Tax=Gadus macrocephalus TaxID=80720 RepID=UPI0028CB8BA4|nr:cyclin N-terminal domain-containing protein 1 [Gadus macrocephalus]